jgi:Tfp pilus assembly protein PilW
MSTSDTRGRSGAAGFSVIELILGLALTVCLAVAVAPLWLSLQKAGASESDQTVRLLQARVAVARFERDLRLAGAYGCPFRITAPILEASASQVVLLVRSADGAVPTLVEWEIVNGALMRRWGACPPTRPKTFAHSLFVDSKTMLEGVAKASAFAYRVDGEAIDVGSGPVDLTSIDGVVLELRARADGATALVAATARGRVGR